MGKVRRLGNLLRRKDFLAHLGGTLVAILGIVSAVFGITGWHLDWSYFAVLGVLVTSAVAFLAHRQTEEPLLSVDDIAIEDTAISKPMRVHCPCTRSLADSAKQLANHYFGSVMNIDPNTYEQLRAKNRFILACLTTRSGDLLGYFDAIPLEEHFAQSFLKGDVTEAQLTHEVVLSPEEMPSCKYLYLAGIAVWKARTPAGGRSTRVLVWALLGYLEKFYGKSEPFAFAVTTTKPGEELARRFGMNLEADTYSGIERFKLFSTVLSSEGLRKRISVVDDCGALCTLDWEDEERKRGGGKLRQRTPPQRRRPSSSQHRLCEGRRPIKFRADLRQ
jgi:hypothetical protein